MNQSCVFFGLVLYQDGVTIVEEFLNPGWFDTQIGIMLLMAEILHHFVSEGLSPHPLNVNIAATQVQEK